MSDMLKYKLDNLPGELQESNRNQVKATMIPSFDDLEGSPEVEIMGLPFGGPFSGRDRDGEAFHVLTEFTLNVGDEVVLTYLHGFGPDAMGDIQDPIAWLGRAKFEGATSGGGVFIGRLNLNEPLVRRIIDGDEVMSSSGAVSHLVRYNPTSKGLIDTWPVGELAIFDTSDERQPSNPMAWVDTKGCDQFKKSFISNFAKETKCPTNKQPMNLAAIMAKVNSLKF